VKKATPKAEPKIKGKTIRSVTLFLDLIILGFAIGFVYSRFAEWDLFHRWRQLPDAPSAVSELLTVFPGTNGDDYTLYLSGTDGQVYSCDQPEGECWIPAELPDPASQPPSDSDLPHLAGDIYADCTAGSSFFAFMTDQPRQVDDCLQFRIEFKGGFTDAALALHPNGSLWGWSNSHSGNETIQSTLYAIGIGIAAGALVAVLWIVFRGQREKE
jgi:hypothetical protein